MTDLHTPGFVSPLDNPSAANALISSLTKEAPVAKPDIPLPAGGHFRLPGGLVIGSDYASVRYDAEVRELTGADEEAITKARSGGIGKFMSTLLQRGTVEVGGQPSSPGLLSNLLIGDRDMLLLEIRRATFGEEITWDKYTCPHCSEEFHLSITLDEIPVRRMEDPSKRVFEVPLRNSRKAFVRLPMGADQEALLTIADRSNISEQNTLLLSRCVISIVEADGSETAMAGNIDLARSLGIQDRKTILNAFDEKQPGPQYNDIKFTHDSCGKEVPVFVSIGDLFQGM